MKCALCGHEDKTAPDLAADAELIVDHIRVMHPDRYDGGLERWPDGGIVLEDDGIEPGDFQ